MGDSVSLLLDRFVRLLKYCCAVVSAHLTSKCPDEFDACVMRNPVTDLPSMLYATDIPDW